MQKEFGTDAILNLETPKEIARDISTIIITYQCYSRNKDLSQLFTFSYNLFYFDFHQNDYVLKAMELLICILT